MYVPHCPLYDEDIITQLDHIALILLFKKEWVLFESEDNSVKPNNPRLNERFAMFVQFLTQWKINITAPINFSFIICNHSP